MTPGSWCALITLGCFMTLASFAYGTTAPRSHTVRQAITAEVDMEPQAASNVGYDLSVVSSLNDLAARKPTHSERAAHLKRRQAEAYATALGITPKNMNAYKERW